MSETSTTENPANDQPQIGVVELQNMVKIIDVAAERGAFKGNELTAVGTTRDRVASFLAAVAPPEPEVPAEETPEPATATPKKTRAKK